MKRRLVKKWINRYLKPLIKDLPRTEYLAQKIDIDRDENGFEMCVVIQKQHSIKNGYVIPEGYIVPPGNGLRNNIIRTAKEVKRILDTHKYIFLIVEPRIYGQRVYMRLITE